MTWLTGWLVCGLVGAALDIRSIRRAINDSTPALAIGSWIGAALGFSIAILLGPLQLVAVIAILCSRRLREKVRR